MRASYLREDLVPISHLTDKETGTLGKLTDLLSLLARQVHDLVSSVLFGVTTEDFVEM